MSERVTLDTTSDGRLVAVKHARDAEDADRLRREADLLEVARHPGVVELVRLEDDDRADGSGVRLVTIAVGNGPLDLMAKPPVPQVAAIVAAAATTLADLHLHGIVHGRIDGTHVLIDGDGRPVLCGFGHAAARDGAARGNPPDDVAGLGRLMLRLLGHDADLEPIPELRRRPGRRRREGWTGYQLRALLTLADQASADDPRHRPSARALAAALAAAFPDARTGPPARPAGGDGALRAAAGPLPADTNGSRRPSLPMPGRRAVMAGGAAVVGVLGLAALAAGTAALDSSPRPEVLAAPDDGGAPTSSSTTTTTTTNPPSDDEDDCPATDGPVADLDGDGCASSLIVEGTVVSGEGLRFQVGSDGDEVVLGDWDCDGHATPALLRPEDGEVFVFSRWARDGADVTVEALTEVAGVTGIEVRHTDGCDHLVLDGPDGSFEVSGDQLTPGAAG